MNTHLSSMLASQRIGEVVRSPNVELNNNCLSPLIPNTQS